jgi:hypothetical protein
MPLGVLLVVGALVLFCLLATLGKRHAWPHSTASAFFVVWIALGAFQLMQAWELPEPTKNAHTLSAAVRSAIAMLGGALVFVGSAAAAFAVLRRRSALIQSVAATFVAILSLPVAMGVLVYLACMFDLGCA